MAFRPKSADAIAKMRTAGQTVAEVLGALEAMAAPGVTTVSYTHLTLPTN